MKETDSGPQSKRSSSGSRNITSYDKSQFQTRGQNTDSNRYFSQMKTSCTYKLKKEKNFLRLVTGRESPQCVFRRPPDNQYPKETGRRRRLSKGEEILSVGRTPQSCFRHFRGSEGRPHPKFPNFLQGHRLISSLITFVLEFGILSQSLTTRFYLRLFDDLFHNNPLKERDKTSVSELNFSFKRTRFMDYKEFLTDTGSDTRHVHCVSQSKLGTLL